MPKRPFDIWGVSTRLSGACSEFTKVCIRCSNVMVEHLSSILVSNHPAPGTSGDVDMDDRTCQLSPSLILMINSLVVDIERFYIN
jgi:hypothetical protein